MEGVSFENKLCRWDFIGKGLDHEENLIYGRDYSLVGLRWMHAIFAACTPEELETCVQENPKLELFHILKN